MRMVLKVAKAELRTLFYSPVAWFLTIAFLVVCGYFYTNILYPYANWQDVYVKNNPDFTSWEKTSFTPILFLGPDGIFQNVLRNLYLFIPLLTMGLIGREINNGTIKLLFSSPVKLRQIVLGKYLAIMIFNLMLVLIVGIFIVSGMLNMRSPDYGMLLSAALGLYLLTCAYTAIGLFMSSLTTYQIVSAISTFIVIFILSRIGGLWQQYDFVRDLTYFLFLSGRTEKMMVGLLTTKDVLYFIVVVYMFVGFTLIRLRNGRESKPWYISTLRYTVVAISGLMAGYISSRPVLTGYWDTTAQKINTIHEKTQKIIKDLGDEPLEVTLYTNLLGGGAPHGFPAGRNIYLSGFWEQYQRFKPDIEFNYVYYYDYDSTVQGNSLYRQFPGKTLEKIAANVAGYMELNLSKFKLPAEIRRQIDLKPEGLRLVMQLQYKGRKEFLRTFDDNKFWPDEEQVAAAMKRLLQPALPRAFFITGDLERNIYKSGEREFEHHTTGKDHRTALINLGFEVDTLSLDNRDIPADAAILVLADPKTSLSAVSLQKIRQYIDKGGNMFILGEPGKQQMLNPLLQPLGVRLMNGTLVVPTYNEMPHMLAPHFTNEALSLFDDPARDHFIKMPDKDIHILMPGATALSYNDSAGFTTAPLLTALENVSWLKAGKLVTDSAAVLFKPEEGDIKGLFAPAIALTRQVNNKQQRIIICGDADFMSNLRPQSVRYGIYFYGWLDGGGFPVFLPRPNPLDNFITVTGKGAATLKILYIWVLPGMVLLAGAILLIRRKRK